MSERTGKMGQNAEFTHKMLERRIANQTDAIPVDLETLAAGAMSSMCELAQDARNPIQTTLLPLLFFYLENI